ncbi:MAG: glycosyltransferase family A protein [Gaiellaceae bacterium]
MTPDLRVAVILPCHNDGPLLLEALGSIDEIEPVEVVVVDDHSTEDETLAALEMLPAWVGLVRHEANEGLAVARNTGLHATKAPYVLPLDADDLAVAGALTAMADRLDSTPEAAVCFGDYLEFGDHELVRVVPAGLDPFRLAYINEYPVTSLFRRSALQEVGGWRKVVPGYEDWDLWLSLVERGYEGVHLGSGRLTYRRRLHGERMLTAAKREHRARYLRLRDLHPRLFADISRHRGESDLSLRRKLLYPVVYGGRPRFGFEQRLKGWLDEHRIWTLRR